MSYPSERPLHMVALQALRAEAAIIVVMTHVFDRLVKFSLLNGASEKATWIGHIGVDLFFTISGFIMVKTTREEFGQRGASIKFFCRRLWRIAPLYYVFTALLILKTFLLKDRTIAPSDILLSFLFVPYRNSEGLMQPFYGLGWSLNYEMYFYAVFAVTLCFTRIIGLFLCVGLIALIFAMQAWLLPPEGGSFLIEVLRYIGQPIVFYFISGMLIAIIAEKGSKVLPALNANFAVVLGILALIASVLFLEIPFLRGACCVAAVFFAALEAPTKASSPALRVADFFGSASYSIYLTHSFVLGPVVAVGLKFGVSGIPGISAMTCCAVALCLVVAAKSYLWIEKPLQNFAKSLGRRRRLWWPALSRPTEFENPESNGQDCLPMMKRGNPLQ